MQIHIDHLNDTKKYIRTINSKRQKNESKKCALKMYV